MENLTEMVKANTEPVVFSQENLDIPAEVVAAPEAPAAAEAAPVVETPPAPAAPVEGQIDIVELPGWFDQNVASFTNIRKVTVSIQGVDPNEQIIITIPDATEENPAKRKLVVFNDVFLTPVLNIPAMDMRVFTNGFRILYDKGNGQFIKSYVARSSLTSVYCVDIDNALIPYKIVKARKKDSYIVFEQAPAIEAIRQKMQAPLNMENLVLQYKQSSKVENGFGTTKDAIDWLLQRQGDVTDINHHLQIDNIIINLLS